MTAFAMPARCAECHQYLNTAQDVLSFDLSFARKISKQSREGSALTALKSLLDAFDLLAARYAQLTTHSTQLETETKIARSNLALAEANADMLEEALKKRQRTPEMNSAPFPSQVNTSPNPAAAADMARDRSLSFWKRKRPVIMHQSSAPPATHDHTEYCASDRTSTTESNLSLAPAPKSPVDTISSIQSTAKDEELSKLKSQLSNLLSQQASSAADLSAARAHVSALAQEHSGLQSQHADLLKSHAALGEAHENLKAELEQLSQELFEEANKMVAEERKSRVALEEQLVALQEELAILKRTTLEAQQMSKTPSAPPRTSSAASAQNVKPQALVLQIPTQNTEGLPETPIDSLFVSTQGNSAEARSPGLEAAKAWFSSLRRPKTSPSSSVTNLQNTARQSDQPLDDGSSQSRTLAADLEVPLSEMELSGKSDDEEASLSISPFDTESFPSLVSDKSDSPKEVKDEPAELDHKTPIILDPARLTKSIQREIDDLLSETASSTHKMGDGTCDSHTKPDPPVSDQDSEVEEQQLRTLPRRPRGLVLPFRQRTATNESINTFTRRLAQDEGELEPRPSSAALNRSNTVEIGALSRSTTVSSLDTVSTIAWDEQDDSYTRDAIFPKKTSPPQKLSPPSSLHASPDTPLGLALTVPVDVPALTEQEAIADIIATRFPESVTTTPQPPSLSQMVTPSVEFVTGPTKDLYTTTIPKNLNALRNTNMHRMKSDTPEPSGSSSSLPQRSASLDRQSPVKSRAPEPKTFFERYDAKAIPRNQAGLENRQLWSRAGRLRDRQQQDKDARSTASSSKDVDALDSLLSNLKAEYGMEFD